MDAWGDMEFWSHVFTFHSADVTEYLEQLMFTPDALVMGRATYEGFAEVLPTRDGRVADKINGMPKYVASRTLKAPLAWNATLIERDAATEIGELKEDKRQGLLQYGIGELTRPMLEAQLVDEVRLLVFPFTYGRGPRIFEDMGVNTLKLVETRTFDSGVVALHYEPTSHASA